MKTIGYLLVTLGFIAAALVSVWQEDQTPWQYYIPTLSVGILGVVLLRLHHRQQIGGAQEHVHQVQNLTDCLQRITDQLARLMQSLSDDQALDIHTEIDRCFTNDLAAFVEDRQSITHAHGLQAYADIMSSFAAAERYLNRVWSASADGYVDEVRDYMTRAQEQFNDSLQRLKDLSTTAVTQPPT
jgi:hypothetical protein